MVKVLHIVASLIGGAGEHVYSLLSHTDRSRFQLYLIAPDDFPPLSRRISELDVAWIKVPIDSGLHLSAFRTIRKLVKEENIQIVHSHGIRAGLYGRLGGLFTGSKSVYTIHGFHPAHYRSTLKKAASLCLERFLGKHCTDRIICVSDSDRHQVERHLKCNDLTEKIITIPNGIDVDSFRSAPNEEMRRREFLNPDKQILLGTVGRLRPQKSMVTLVEVAAILKQKGWRFRLLIIGEGHQERMLRERIAALDVEEEVVLTGYRDDVREILKILDVFLLSSLWEGLPLVVLEALAAGVPIIATNVSGTDELLKPVYGEKLVVAQDPTSFVAMLENWNRDRETWRELALLGQDFVSERYDTKIMVKGTENIYSELV